jgi:serine/threonine protein phosphatase PrpC
MSVEAAWHGRPCTGHTLSGDAAVVVPWPGGAFLGIVDVLGHGPSAHEVARRAAAFLAVRADPDVTGVLRALHEDLRSGLGAVAGACWIDGGTGEVRWAAVGNVTLRSYGSVTTRLDGRDGLLGQVLPTLREQGLRLGAGDVLLLTTDGIRDQVSLAEYPGLREDDPAFAARRVVLRFGREHDDATCIVARMRA